MKVWATIDALSNPTGKRLNKYLFEKKIKERRLYFTIYNNAVFVLAFKHKKETIDFLTERLRKKRPT